MQENQNEVQVGDWVIGKDVCNKSKKFTTVSKLKEMRKPSENAYPYILENGSYCADIQKWIPKEDEWCWFYKKNSKNAVFAKFKRLLDSNLGIYEAVGYTPNGADGSDKEEYGYFYSCAPFIGELPE